MNANQEEHEAGCRDEAQLHNECKSGSTDSFVCLITPYLPSVRMAAYAVLRNREDVEDAVQETVLKAFTNIHQLREVASIRPWLVQIAVNEARMRQRKYQPHRFESLQDDEDEEEFRPRQFVDWRNMPLKELEREELRSALIAALNRLDDGYREVFVLRDVQHISAQEVGQMLDLSEAAVNTRLHRARLRMREMLTPLFRVSAKRWGPMSLKMVKLMGKRFLRKTISCTTVLSEISDYIDGNPAPALKAEIEEHLRTCDRCSAILDSTKKLLYIAGQEKVFAVPFTCNDNWKQLLREVRRSAPPFRKEHT
jgi:RNA polymerase sigma-70 factor (ECF subfamily)